MKAKIFIPAIMLALSFALWETRAQEIVGYSDFFTFDTRFTHVLGNINDADSGDPIAGALVTVSGPSDTYSATSQADGSFDLGEIMTGNYPLAVLKLGFEEYNQVVFITGEPAQTINISLTPGTSTYVMINDSIAAFGDNINENPPNVFTLSGNVHINGVLYFEGDITVDKRAYLNYPEISGSCGLFAKDIGSYDTYWIKQNNIQFVYYALEKRLIPSQWAYILDGSFMIGGFNITIGELIVDPSFDYVEIKSIAEMPFPIKKVIEHLQNEYPDDLPLFVQKMSGSRILSRSNGMETAVDISGIGVNIGIVELENVNLFFNTNTDTYGGGFTLRIPGSVGSKCQESYSTLAADSVGEVPVEIRDENEQVVDTMSFHEFLDVYRAGGFALVSLGAQIEFIQGAINRIIISIGTSIPLGTTGLFLTQVTGGVDDLATENWKILANVDIELGYSVPVLGSPVKFDDFGILIQPWNSFRGGGQFKVFNYTVSEGYVEYNRPLNSLSAECKVNLYGGILQGRTYFGLVGGHASGSGTLSVHTPSRSSLPWYLKWAGNKNIGSAQASFNNKYFQSSVQLWFIKFAQKLVFGKTSFPWFHYYLGRNMNKLHKIWKGERDGKQVVTFTVPENSQQLLVVAMDTLNPAYFNFTLEDPSGQVFDQYNAYHYELNDSVQQTIMSLLNPLAGEWDFITDYDGFFDVDVSITNQESTLLITEPMARRTRSNLISLCLNDYADTMNVQVYYDKSNIHYNGKMINEFNVINNGTLDFIWQNQYVPNGEYYIYCRIDDGYNAPYLQYANGSIWVENVPGIESPENFSVYQENDAIVASWDEPQSDNIIATAVYAKNITSGRTTDETAFESNSLMITGFEPGQEYRLWACFITANSAFSEPGDTVNIIFTNGERNNPPYFTLNPDSMFVFTEGRQNIYKLTANDADGDALTFHIPDDTLGIAVFGNSLIWTPAEEDRGVYDLKITVTDGSDNDTIFYPIIVYAPFQVNVNLAFSSKNLYEDDNMFIRLKNYFCPDAYQQVLLTNTRTQEQTTVTARKVNDAEYIGKFGLSWVNRSELAVADGDTIMARYIYLDEEYYAYACYDSLPQPSDNIPPGTISDLTIEQLQANFIKLIWTATGNDLDSGKAYRYDIRYAFEAINDEGLYLTANRITAFPYPSYSGIKDSLIIDLMDLQDISLHSMVYFSIKAEDEMQNRGGLSNSPGIQCAFNPANVTAAIRDVYYIDLDWEGPLPGKNYAGLQHYDVFRKLNEGALSLLQSGVLQTEFTDNLKNNPDGIYQYAIQAIYDSASSDLVFAPSVNIERFINTGMLFALSDTNDYQGIAYEISGLDNIYGQHYSGTTNTTGLVLIDDVFFSQYSIVASKNGYVTLQDTIEVSKTSNTFSLVLSPVNPGYIIDLTEKGRPFFKIQPNPTDGIFTLEMLDSDNLSIIRVEIYDMKGEIIERVELSGQKSHVFDLSKNPAGIYLFMVHRGEEQGMIKVILRR
jgi:hypothetical protein